MTDKPEDRLALPDQVGDYLELGGLFASVVPVLGGAVQQVLTGWSTERRFQRLNEVLRGACEDIKALGGKVATDYVRSDEFADLLDQTLRRVAGERHEEKRRVLRAFLVDAVTKPADYDEQLRILRTIDLLQAAHVQVIRAVMQPADPNTNVYMGSFLNVLERRLGSVVSRALLEDLIQQLNDHKVLNMSLHTTMMGAGAENTSATVTDYGRRVIKYVMEGSA